MKDELIRTVAVIVICGLLAGILSGCYLKKKPTDYGILDGPGMVNYDGLLLDALLGDWSDGDECYRLTIGSGYTVSMYYNDAPLLEDGALTLCASSADTNEYSEFSICPSTLTDGSDEFAEITKAFHENGTITLELTLADGTKTEINFEREYFMLDGPGMVYEGAPLDQALTGCWYSEDGRYTLEADGKCAAFYVDGRKITSLDEGYFFDHRFAEGDDLNERCDLWALWGSRPHRWEL